MLGITSIISSSNLPFLMSLRFDLFMNTSKHSIQLFGSLSTSHVFWLSTMRSRSFTQKFLLCPCTHFFLHLLSLSTFFVKFTSKCQVLLNFKHFFHIRSSALHPYASESFFFLITLNTYKQLRPVCSLINSLFSCMLDFHFHFNNWVFFSFNC